MKGNIYTRQKCKICNGRMVHNDNRNGCFCEKHKKEQATSQFYVKFGKDINKRFPNYEKAARFLTSLRYETDRGTFDVRDHQANKPLGFCNLAERYLDFKEKQNLTSFHHIKRYIIKASLFFGDTNVKNIKRKDIRDFLDTLKVSDKTKKNYASQLHDFWYNFLYEEEEILDLSQLPKFPKIDVQLGFRKLVDIDIREKIIDKLKEMSYDRNPKIWLAVDLLCTYNSLRPGDLRRLREGDIDLDYGVLTFWRPTKSKNKKDPKVIRIRLLNFHIAEFRSLKKQYPAVDSVLFFRKPDNEPFGINLLYKTWKKACKVIGIHDVDLYGGTRHSSITAIAKAAGKDKARKYSGHLTNKAFDRYCQIGDDDTFDISQLMAKMRSKAVNFNKVKANDEGGAKLSI